MWLKHYIKLSDTNVSLSLVSDLLEVDVLVISICHISVCVKGGNVAWDKEKFCLVNTNVEQVRYNQGPYYRN